MVFASCFYGQSSRLCGNRYSGHVLRNITTQTVYESTASAMLRFRSCDGGRRESQIRSPFLTPWDCLPLLITSNVRFFREKKKTWRNPWSMFHYGLIQPGPQKGHVQKLKMTWMSQLKEYQFTEIFNEPLIVDGFGAAWTTKNLCIIILEALISR